MVKLATGAHTLAFRSDILIESKACDGCVRYFHYIRAPIIHSKTCVFILELHKRLRRTPTRTHTIDSVVRLSVGRFKPLTFIINIILHVVNHTDVCDMRNTNIHLKYLFLDMITSVTPQRMPKYNSAFFFFLSLFVVVAFVNKLKHAWMQNVFGGWRCLLQHPIPFRNANIII